MGCGIKLVGALLIVFNILVFFFGLALMVVGVWSIVDKLYVAHVIGDDLFSAASYLVIIGAVVLLALAVLGVCAVRKERRRLVLIYFIMLLVVFLLLLTTAILAAAFKGELEEEMTDAMRNTLVTDYGDDSSVTDAWDRLQQDLKCCAVLATTSHRDSWLLYQQTPWYRSARLLNRVPVKLVPRSCCVYDEKIGGMRDVTQCQTWQLGPPGNLRFTFVNNALYYDGCYEKAKDFIGDQADVLLGCGFAFAFSLLAGLALTLMLYRLLGEHTRVIKR